MVVRPHRISQCIPSRRWAGEDFQFAVAIIIEPLDAPFAGCFAILENLRWLAAVKRLRLVLRLVLRFVAHRGVDVMALTASLSVSGFLSGIVGCPMRFKMPS